MACEPHVSRATTAGGSIAWLQKFSDGTAAGRVLHTPASFMPLLSDSWQAPKIPRSMTGTQRTSDVSGSVLDDWTFSFFAQPHMSESMVRDHHREPDGTHVTTLFDPHDESYARVSDRASGPGATVIVSGRRDLWEPIEKAREHWLGLHRPRREWFTISATPDSQTVSYTAPDGHAWHWDL
ncbi:MULTISPECIES: hypothetical protein [unclassified Streptomyces]|uniref:hypothetical protein n=1 Tax=unclassified Streptomyces TaxID=2593676 RepID=UPI003806A598